MVSEQYLEGTVPFKVPSTGAEAHTYYKVFDDLGSGRTPLIVLHGGPAGGHEYCLPFAELHSLYGMPVIFYDQIGCAKSAHFRERVHDEEFWHMDLFLSELQNLITHLALDRIDGPGYDILGHSWGGMLAAHFASQHRDGLRRVVLASPPSSGEKFAASMWTRLDQLSPGSRSIMEKAVATNDFSTPEYLAVLGEWACMFHCKARPYPHPLLEFNLQHKKDDPTVLLTLLGESPWKIEGSFREMDTVSCAKDIDIPVLILNGEFDTCDDSQQEDIFRSVPNSRWVKFAGGSHMYFLDSDDLKAKTLELVNEFLLSKSGGWRQGERWTV